MPELPDVEVYRRYLDATALHREIRAVESVDEEMLDEEGWLALHFGMTGELCDRSRGGLKRLLTDQASLAGIGNTYADEILFHARLRARRLTARGGEEQQAAHQERAPTHEHRESMVVAG